MTPQQQKELSKHLSLVLRHRPEKYHLQLDSEGFVLLANLIAGMRTLGKWSRVTEEQVREVVRDSDKQRYEIVGEKIRARYGHSVAEAVSYEPIAPPEILYHGTARRVVDAIRAEGLRPMNRQYVHLSSEIEQARIVGARHDARPVILTVRAGEAHAQGVRFYNPEPRLYLADLVTPEFIDFGD
ncbi:putative RNA 2'-phosphotransferase [Capsulimonas corticalis]|uniref:Probable RNA 2'-phosphotransferase n=1 Tax=Capsulimonas corticalis TaxID=2219043 RepID=A0A402D570_9BACT|nr:RNA 2'-phosphotransferase [Capsulimonas corticalis]BDI29877.1 putative RNA 2'-phosphotransferase [Capsulimonas corticalis]